MTEPIRKHYVHWYTHQADMMAQVESRDPHVYHNDTGAWWLQFYDILELELEVDGEVITLKSEPFNYSPVYLYDVVPDKPDVSRTIQGAVHHSLRGFGWKGEKYQVVRQLGNGHRFAVLAPVEILSA